jgi:hypothetical protein
VDGRPVVQMQEAEDPPVIQVGIQARVSVPRIAVTNSLLPITA